MKCVQTLLFSISHTQLCTEYSIDIYPCKISNSTGNHFFVRFSDKQSLECALKINLRGLRVYSLLTNPHLIDECRASMNTNPALLPPLMSAELLHELKTKTTASWNTHLSSSRRFLSSPTAREYISGHGTPTSNPQAVQAPQTLVSHATLNSSTGNDKKNFSRASIPSILLAASASRSSEGSSLSNLNRSSSPIHFSLGCSSQLPTLLNFCFCGENIAFDLKNLEQDSRPVIELLKLTASDCGNWMMVGAHYRRSGNTRAAVSVIETMINGRGLALSIFACEFKLTAFPHSDGQSRCPRQ